MSYLDKQWQALDKQYTTKKKERFNSPRHEDSVLLQPREVPPAAAIYPCICGVTATIRALGHLGKSRLGVLGTLVRRDQRVHGRGRRLVKLGRPRVNCGNIEEVVRKVLVVRTRFAAKCEKVSSV